jgi:hypothetical protein
MIYLFFLFRFDDTYSLNRRNALQEYLRILAKIPLIKLKYRCFTEFMEIPWDQLPPGEDDVFGFPGPGQQTRSMIIQQRTATPMKAGGFFSNENPVYYGGGGEGGEMDLNNNSNHSNHNHHIYNQNHSSSSPHSLTTSLYSQTIPIQEQGLEIGGDDDESDEDEDEDRSGIVAGGKGAKTTTGELAHHPKLGKPDFRDSILETSLNQQFDDDGEVIISRP